MVSYRKILNFLFHSRNRNGRQSIVYLKQNIYIDLFHIFAGYLSVLRKLHCRFITNRSSKNNQNDEAVADVEIGFCHG